MDTIYKWTTKVFHGVDAIYTLHYVVLSVDGYNLFCAQRSIFERWTLFIVHIASNFQGVDSIYIMNYVVCYEVDNIYTMNYVVYTRGGYY